MDTDKLPSYDTHIPPLFVTPLDDNPMRIMSTSARGTSVLINDEVCVDAGNLPVSIAQNIKLLLITHGHADHIRDICNAYSEDNGKMLYIVCPASIALDIFNIIRYTHQANKGRKYSINQIQKHLCIYAVHSSMDNFKHITQSEFSHEHNCRVERIIAMSILSNMIVDIYDEYSIKAFPCHHTVNTYGYGIYRRTYVIPDIIKIPTGLTVEITPPKMSKNDKKCCRDNINRINFDSVNRFEDFCKDNGIECDIEYGIVSRKMTTGYILDNIRQITFNSDCTINVPITNDVKQFFDEYSRNYDKTQGISVHSPDWIPLVMVFGDTASTVFKNKFVKQVINEFPIIVIECTYLEGEETLSKYTSKNSKRNKYEKLKDNKHIFLPELYPIFEKYPNKRFVLMHFSDRYTKTVVKRREKMVRKMYQNVYFSIE
jgi:ribonuclease BN (tRNA processing enzyme)